MIFCGPQRMLREDFTTHVHNCHALNVNSHAVGMHMAKKRELQSEWRRMLPTPGQEFASLAINMGLDAKKPPPRTESELQTWWQKEILEDEDYEKKGEFMRQSSWYSSLKLIHKNKGKWHCKKYHAQKVADQLVKSPEGNK